MSQEIVNSLYNEIAEQDILGALLIDNSEIDKLTEILRKEYFYLDINKKIYEVITSLINQNSVADVTNITHKINSDSVMSKDDIKSYLISIMTQASSGIPIKDRARIVQELYTKRSMVSLAGSIKDGISGKSAEIVANEVEKTIFDIRQLASSNSKSPQKLGSFLPSIVKLTENARNGNVASGTPTGYSGLDGLINGLNPSDLLILAARPSMGKTALAVNIAYNIASHALEKNTGGVAIFSLEMSSEQIATRILSMISGVNSTAIRTGKYPKFEHTDEDQGGQRMSEDDFSKLCEVSSMIENLPLFIDDTPSISTSLLRTKARMLKTTHNISAIVIDYLQLMRGSESASANNRVLEISEISQTLKAIAKELNIPVIALSQLSRQVEARDDKRPQLSDLRESGSIEQDADLVMFIYREEYYLEKSKPKPPMDPSDIQAKDTKEYNAWVDKMFGKPLKGTDGAFIIDQHTGEIKLQGGAKNIAEIIIAKHRNGPTGSTRLFFDKVRTAFYDLAD